MAAAIQAVIFDLDGTLVAHRASVISALSQWLPTLGSAVTSELVDAWCDAEQRHFPAWRARQVTFAEQRRRRLRDFLPLIGIAPGNDNDLDDIFAGYLVCYQRSWTAFDDVEPALAATAGSALKVAVLTNGTVEQQNAPRTAGLQALHLDRANTGPGDEIHRITSLRQLPAMLSGVRATRWPKLVAARLGSRGRPRPRL